MFGFTIERTISHDFQLLFSKSYIKKSTRSADDFEVLNMKEEGR